MSSAGVDAIVFQDLPSPPSMRSQFGSGQSIERQRERFQTNTGALEGLKGLRRTPRKSLIVVLPENHVVSADLVADRLSAEGDNEEMVDVILACAGQPGSLAALQRRVRDLQVLLAPAGTSTEDLRELAMNQAPGDIVTLLTGIPA